MTRKKFRDYVKGAWDRYKRPLGMTAVGLGILGLSYYLDKKEREYNNFDGPIADKNVEYSNLMSEIGDNITGEKSNIMLFSVMDNGEKKWIITPKGGIPAGADSAKGYFKPTGGAKYGDKKIGDEESVEKFH